MAENVLSWKWVWNVHIFLNLFNFLKFFYIVIPIISSVIPHCSCTKFIISSMDYSPEYLFHFCFFLYLFFQIYATCNFKWIYNFQAMTSNTYVTVWRGTVHWYSRVATTTVAQLAGWKQQRGIFSQFWLLEVQNQGLGRAMLLLKSQGQVLLQLFHLLMVTGVSWFATTYIQSLLPSSGVYLPCVSVSSHRISLFLQVHQKYWIKAHAHDSVFT